MRLVSRALFAELEISALRQTTCLVLDENFCATPKIISRYFASHTKI
ncbi:hypothetical protein CSUNSWCD_2308 [Campylobacter showae CSUNSWCD]|uniref:Uncharacterized protein n=1 Tax=Campylobacter showae CSUNSWCD TaxID=1244083 RepID=M5IJV2_9BACT|nr:hypothetical protein CSUNSWCD_2308 [Campylobacter showae CSUNSWCD]